MSESNLMVLDNKKSTTLECPEKISIRTKTSSPEVYESLIKQVVATKPKKMEEIEAYVTAIKMNSGDQDMGSTYIVQQDSQTYTFGIYTLVSMKLNRLNTASKYYTAQIKMQPLNHLNSAEIMEGQGICAYNAAYP